MVPRWRPGGLGGDAVPWLEGNDLGGRRARARHRLLAGRDQARPESDGLFDLGDLFATTLTLAGAEDKVPTDRYIDSIDQTSYLLADDGASTEIHLLLAG